MSTPQTIRGYPRALLTQDGGRLVDSRVRLRWLGYPRASGRYGYATRGYRGDYPRAYSFTTTEALVSASTHYAGLPEAGIQVGDCILMLVNAISQTISSVDGFNFLYSAVENSENLAAYWRLCDGLEDIRTLVTLGGAGLANMCAVLIKGGYPYTGASGDQPPFTGANTTRNPPNLALSRGIVKGLWFAISGNGASSGPTDPGDLDFFVTALLSGANRLGVGAIQLRAASYDPTTHGSGTSNNTALTLCVPPKDVRL